MFNLYFFSLRNNRFLYKKKRQNRNKITKHVNEKGLRTEQTLKLPCHLATQKPNPKTEKPKRGKIKQIMFNYYFLFNIYFQSSVASQFLFSRFTYQILTIQEDVQEKNRLVTERTAKFTSII